MKKANYIILGILIISIGGVIYFTSSKSFSNKEEVAVNKKSKEEVKEEIKEEKKELKPLDIDLTKTLFIGDSRTVGLMEYSKMNEPDYFCNVGMSVFNVMKKTVSVPNVGKITLNNLLESQKYQTIFIMLGINELGYELNSITSKYEEVVNLIKNKLPNSDIIILGNLHVTQARSNKDKIFNNERINILNKELSNLVDDKQVFYIDTNYLFDVDGALDSKKTFDNIHLYGSYYEEWGNWIVGEARKLKEE